MMNKLALSIVGLLVTGVASAQFVNGGFETGDLSGWTVTPTTNGQTLLQDVTMFDMDFSGPGSASNAARFRVGQVVFQSGVPAGIELTQSINLSIGVNYVIEFDWAAHRETSASGNNAEGGIFDLIVNGSVLATGAAGSTNSTTEKFGTVTANFTPSVTGAHIVGARITRPFIVPGDLYQRVDNFSAVPEPGSMIALGLGAAALLARRRKKSVA